jgi:hypothetical protein
VTRCSGVPATGSIEHRIRLSERRRSFPRGPGSRALLNPSPTDICFGGPQADRGRTGNALAERGIRAIALRAANLGAIVGSINGGASASMERSLGTGALTAMRFTSSTP